MMQGDNTRSRASCSRGGAGRGALRHSRGRQPVGAGTEEIVELIDARIMYSRAASQRRKHSTTKNKKDDERWNSASSALLPKHTAHKETRAGAAATD